MTDDTEAGYGPEQTRPDGQDAQESDRAMPEAKLENLPERIRQAAARAGWADLMPVQARAIPYVLAKQDLMVQSRTGSGKTGGFILPILERLDLSRDVCQALILVPTRELARQVAQDAETMAGDGGARVVAVYGGAGYGAQIDAFKRGAHIVVGTPGRILDHLLRRSLSLADLSVLVFDEADRMLSIGFYPDMKEVQRYLPKRRINSLMFSATFPPYVQRLAGEFLNDPDFLSLSGDNVHVAEVEHQYCELSAMDKDRALIRFIEIENPASAIIFCNTKSNVHYVTAVLQGFGYDADELSADLTQINRDRVLARVRAGSLRFLVATDVAARGIDIPDLSHVFLYDIPEDQETYIHRAGRTGRAGATGTVITLVDAMELLTLQRIAAKFKIHVLKLPVPTDEDVAAVVAQRVTTLLEAELRTRPSLRKERQRRFVSLARSLGENEDAAMLVAMLLDDYYQHTLHDKPPLPEAARPREPRLETRREPMPETAPPETDGHPLAPKRRRRRRKKPGGGE